MHRRHAVFLAALIAHAASPLRADELVLGIDQSMMVQTNLFALPESEISDGTYEIRPIFRFRRPEGKLSYDLSYSPIYEVLLRNDELNGFDHFGHGRIAYDILPIANISLDVDVANFRSTRATTVPGPGGIPDVVPGIAGEINRVFGDLAYEHRFARASRARAVLRVERYGYTTPNGVDSIGFSGEVEAVHELTPILEIGASLLGSWRNFEQTLFVPESDNAVLNPNLLVRLEPMPTVSLSVSAGPGVLFTRTEPSFITGVPVEDDLVTGFVTAELAKEDSWGRIRFAFDRSEQGAAGSGSTTIRDSATAELFLRSGRQWTGNLLFNWNRRISKSPIGIVADLPLRTEIDQIWVELRVTRSITERLGLNFLLQYLRQNREDSFDRGNLDFDNVLAQVTVSFHFAPIEYRSFDSWR